MLKINVKDKGIPMSTKINCPHCALEIDVNERLSHEFENKFKQDAILAQKKFDRALKDKDEKLEAEREAKRREYKQHLQELKAKEDAFEEKLALATKKQVAEEKLKLHAQVKQELDAENQASIAELQRQIQEKSEQVKAFNLAKIEIARLKIEKDEVESKAKADAQIALNSQLIEAKDRLAKEMQEANELKFKAKDEQLDQIKRELDSAQRKIEQGSMQIQGEALELAIESWLSSQFPFDNIEEVKKGAFGADCVHTVNTREVQNCGVICYESKNTKAWSSDWIGKLKNDMLSSHADIGVLVSAVYPKDMTRMGFVDGIWVCSLDEFKGSASLLRESLIKVNQSIIKEENKADKMTLLYNYMTGTEFSMQMKAIVDGFIKMKEELDKEKRSLMASWKRREKTIDGVLQNTTEMYGALQGIAGSSAIVHIDALELLE